MQRRPTVAAGPSVRADTAADARPHREAGRFRNNHIEFTTKSLADVLRWRRDSRRRGVPPPSAPTPQIEPDLGFIHANAGGAIQPAATWIGHSTVLAQFGGLNLLTDPIFSLRASPLAFAGPRRHQPPGIAIRALPHIDLVLVSHNHYDHLDRASVQQLAAQPGGPPLFVVPLGLARWFADQGVAHVVELDWWDRHPLGQASVVLVPAQHWSGRGLRDRMKTLWGGFAVFAPDCHFFYAGDTGYSRDFIEMRERFAPLQSAEAGGGFDLAVLPIGAYEPRWFMAPQHVDVEEAVQIHRDLGAKRSLGVHWGTFQLSDEALDAPPKVLAALRSEQGIDEDEFFVLAVGETRRLPPRSSAESEAASGPDSGASR